MQLLDPRKSREFFRRMRPRSFYSNLRYVAILGLFTFVGTFLMYSVFGLRVSVGAGAFTSTSAVFYPIVGGIWLAAGRYLSAILTPVALGVLVSLFGVKIGGRQVPMEEAVTISCYAYTPTLIVGLLFAFFPVDMFFIPALGTIYTAVLLYRAGEVSFKKEKVGVYLIILSIIISLVIPMILDPIWAVVVGNLAGPMEPVSQAFVLSGEGGSMALTDGGIEFFR